MHIRVTSVITSLSAYTLIGTPIGADSAFGGNAEIESDPIRPSVRHPPHTVTYQLGIHNISATINFVGRDGAGRIGQLSVTYCEQALNDKQRSYS